MTVEDLKRFLSRIPRAYDSFGVDVLVSGKDEKGEDSDTYAIPLGEIWIDKKHRGVMICCGEWSLRDRPAFRRSLCLKN